MLCQNCGKNEAGTHIKRIVDGEPEELHLCADCAQHLGYADLFSGFGFNISSLLRRFFPPAMLSVAENEAHHCPVCGSTFQDIVQSGMMGCAQCYEEFYDQLKPSLSRIHGRATHVGKTGGYADESAEFRARVRALEDELKEAVRTEQYEKAAVLRDELRALRGEQK